MRIENNNDYISIEFIGRAADGLNVWDGFRNDPNSIEIFLGFSTEDDWGMTEGMCVPLKDIEMIYKSLSLVLKNGSFTYSCNFPFESSNDEFITVVAEKYESGIQVFFRIFDGMWDYIELAEVMDEAKFNNILLELEGVIKKYPIV